jgi:hypothetical protein
MLIYLSLYFYYIYRAYTTVFVIITGKERGEVTTKHYIVKLHTLVTMAVGGVNYHLPLFVLYRVEGGLEWLCTHCSHPSTIFC